MIDGLNLDDSRMGYLTHSLNTLESGLAVSLMFTITQMPQTASWFHLNQGDLDETGLFLCVVGKISAFKVVAKCPAANAGTL